MRALLAKTDWAVVATAVILAAVGVLMVYSCTHGKAGASHRYYSQLVAIGVGLAMAAAMALFDYARLQPLAWPIYGLSLVLLVLVLFFAGEVRGAQRWLALGPFHLQPTELAKVAAVIVVAAYWSRPEPGVSKLTRTVVSFLMLGPAMLLSLAQPDMGTPMVLVGSWLVLSYVAGARVAHLLALVSLLLALFAGAWVTNVIKPHQKARLLSFANPEADSQGAGWQVRQSLIAVGSGHLLGQGYMRGTQTQLYFIPDQESDFIFTAIGEELGFLGACFVLGLLGLLIYRATTIAEAARETFGSLLAAGIAGIFLTHVVVNVGMTIGLTPVKGMPLPFLSYGGSHMVACMIMVGILNNVHLRRRRIDFDF